MVADITAGLCQIPQLKIISCTFAFKYGAREYHKTQN